MNDCPHCRKVGFMQEPEVGHCRFCGCRATINPISGNVVFMIRGRIIAAPDDLREQWAKKDGKYAIKGPDPMDPKEL